MFSGLLLWFVRIWKARGISWTTALAHCSTGPSNKSLSQKASPARKSATLVQFSHVAPLLKQLVHQTLESKAADHMMGARADQKAGSCSIQMSGFSAWGHT